MLLALALLGFTEAGGWLGVEGAPLSRGVLLFDYDSDGDADLFIASQSAGGSRLFLYDGDVFRDATARAGLLGLEPLRAVSPLETEPGEGLSIVASRSDLDWPLALLTREDETFREAGVEAGLAGNRTTEKVLVFDADGDGDPDIYELNSELMNNPQDRLWLNEGGRFLLDAQPGPGLDCLDGALYAGGANPALVLCGRDGLVRLIPGETERPVADGSFDGVAAGDIDADGDLDVFVAGAGGNRLYINERGQLTDRSTQMNIQALPGGLDCQFIQADSDPYPELLLLSEGRILYYVDNTEGLLSCMTAKAVSPHGIKVYSFGAGDITGDDRLDLVLTGDFGATVLRGETDRAGVHLMLPYSQAGAQVTGYGGETALSRIWAVESGALSGSALPLFFPAAAGLDSLRVEWTDGTDTTILSPNGGNLITLEKPPVSGRSVKSRQLVWATPNPAFGKVLIGYQLEKAGYVELSIIELSGKTVMTLDHGQKPAGKGSFSFNGKDGLGGKLSQGVYLVRLVTQEGSYDAKLIWFP